APRVGAEGAQLALTEVAALPTGPDLFLDGPQGVGQREHLGAVGGQQVVREALGGLRPDARQLAQLAHQAADRTGRLTPHGHASSARFLPSPLGGEGRRSAASYRGGALNTRSDPASPANSRPAAGPGRSPSWPSPPPRAGATSRRPGCTRPG